MLNKELAINASITGPMLRACGVNYDIRKVDSYGIYPSVSISAFRSANTAMFSIAT